MALPGKALGRGPGLGFGISLLARDCSLCTSGTALRGVAPRGHRRPGRVLQRRAPLVWTQLLVLLSLLGRQSLRDEPVELRDGLLLSLTVGLVGYRVVAVETVPVLLDPSAVVG